MESLENPDDRRTHLIQEQRQLRQQFEAAGGRGVELADRLDTVEREIAALVAAANTPHYHRVKIVVAVVTDREWDPGRLEDVAYEMGDGAFVGLWDVVENVPITAKEAADLLNRYGSEPGFFNLDEDGRSLDEEEEEEVNGRTIGDRRDERGDPPEGGDPG